MPVKKTKCDECGEQDDECPECGAGIVTPRERHGGPKSPNNIVDYGGEGEFKYKHVCWDCGWTEWVTIEVRRSNKENQ